MARKRSNPRRDASPEEAPQEQAETVLVDLLSVENPDAVSYLAEPTLAAPLPLSARLGSRRPSECCPVMGHFTLQGPTTTQVSDQQQQQQQQQFSLAPLPEQARAREAQVLKLLKKAAHISPAKFDSAFSEIFPPSGTIHGTPYASVAALVSDLVAKRPTFLPKQSIKALLGWGAISDHLHAPLVQQLLETGEQEWTLLVLDHVFDLKESSVVGAIMRLLSRHQASVFSPVSSGSPPSLLLLALLSWEFDGPATRLSGKDWQPAGLESLLCFLGALFKLFRQIGGEHLVLEDPSLVGARLPSRSNVLKWIEAVLDLCQDQPKTELRHHLVELEAMVKEEALTVQQLLLLGSQASTLSYLAGKGAGPRERRRGRAPASRTKEEPSQESPASYSLHLVSL